MTETENKISVAPEKKRGSGSNKEYAVRLLQLVFLLSNLPPQKRTGVGLMSIMKINSPVFFRLKNDLMFVMGVKIGRIDLYGEDRLFDREKKKRSVNRFYYADDLGIFNPAKVNAIFLGYGTHDDRESVKDRKKHMDFVKETLEVVNYYRKMYDFEPIS